MRATRLAVARWEVEEEKDREEEEGVDEGEEEGRTAGRRAEVEKDRRAEAMLPED